MPDLPALGRLSGSIAETFGPLFGEGFRLIVPASTDFLLQGLADAAFIFGLRVLGVTRRVAPTSALKFARPAALVKGSSKRLSPTHL